jgi:hypothetical protein
VNCAVAMELSSVSDDVTWLLNKKDGQHRTKSTSLA